VELEPGSSEMFQVQEEKSIGDFSNIEEMKSGRIEPSQNQDMIEIIASTDRNKNDLIQSELEEEEVPFFPQI